ncbi:MAG: DUF885 domain-containing protein [Mycobacteriales bacterium]
MDATGTVRTHADAAWRRVLSRDPVTAIRCGQPVEELPRGGPAALERDVAIARAALADLSVVDGAALGGDDRLTLEFLRDHLTQEVAEAERFWYRFPVTPYQSYVLSDYRAEVLAGAPLASAADADRYLRLLADYAAVVEQFHDTLTEQRRRGIALTGWAAEAALRTMRAHGAASAVLVPGPDRLTGLPPGPASRLVDRAARLVAGRIAAAFERLAADLAAAADGAGGDGGTVGIGRLPGGESAYEGLIRLNTGLDLTADQVHALGLAEVARLTERIRSELGVEDEAEHRRRLAGDPRMHAASPADVERLYQRHLERLAPHLPRYFATLPAAPFRLRRLEPALEGGLTYGFYQPPGLDGVGYYHYNGSDLANRPLLQAASVIFHEGMPGHHLQLGRLREATGLHPIRRELSELRTYALNGYLEGWAEYAAGFCEEIGLYDNPLDRYGRLCAERFQAARLVVDTGLNVRGWSRARAAEYLEVYGSLSPVEIGTEVYRYAVDDPGQALAYHIGHWSLRRLRGDGDPRAFHEAVLRPGPLPLRVLAAHVSDSFKPARPGRS